jgi:asparagine synthase (glutamine-hydrolysing)
LNLTLKQFWKWHDHVSVAESGSIKDNKLHLQALLNNAVKKRLISDVPLGAFLSGGTDSSLITALASRHVSGPLKTFSIGFKDSKFDESDFARQVAKHLKTSHTEYQLAEAEAIDLLETYLHHFDEPFADTSAIPTMLVSKLARQEVKVVLTGDGGDELFQGYGTYAWADRLDQLFWQVFKRPIRAGMMISGKSRLQRISQMLDAVAIGGIRSHIFSQEQYLFSQMEVRDQLLNNPMDFLPFEYDENVLATSNLTAGEKQAIFDLQVYLKDDLLAKVDRSSMYYALECRCPLLDHHVVEYALSLDKSYKVKNGKTKWLLKEILREHLPNHLIDRPKWGFSVPLVTWLKADLRYLIDEFLSDSELQEAGLCNPAYVRKLKSDFFGGKDYLYNRLWVIIVLHKWLKENKG